MKLLFDQNLSPRLVRLLADIFPDSDHLREVGLRDEPDAAIWLFAKEHGFTIVSKDSDFQRWSVRYGAPPKVIWLRVGNCTRHRVESLLRTSYSR
jgi:predicted nuclease of predicted toxin-antitoxin system